MGHVLFVGEGSKDVGREVTRVLALTEDGIQSDDPSPCGVVPILVLRSLAEAKRARRFSFRASSRSRRRSHKGGYGKQVLMAITDAVHDKASAVVVVTDRDGESNQSRLTEMVRGRELAESKGLVCPTALGLAIEELEAWLLADEMAIASATGKRPDRLLPDPEADDNPKATLQTYLPKISDAQEGPWPYEAIAEVIDLETLKKRCPKGFGPFYDEVTKNLSHLTGG